MKQRVTSLVPPSTLASINQNYKLVKKVGHLTEEGAAVIDDRYNLSMKHFPHQRQQTIRNKNRKLNRKGAGGHGLSCRRMCMTTVIVRRVWGRDGKGRWWGEFVDTTRAEPY